ncbi:calcium-responsive transcription factor-like isoform X3 [Polyodon spathula]|uniref:calcium-responsive transcription factor-like isoform X3 n=1 Tax=Polyodon spathula TaxID=7913 RepID=UPI001B7E40D9|nr:calcium-responsive transcription factor-like isoform X3 [Polyodon spathula]
MEENEICMERANELLGAEPNIAEVPESAQQVFQQLPGINASQLTLEHQNSSAVLPITLQITDNPPACENVPEQASHSHPNASSQFHIFDQNGQPVQYERMVIVTGQSENGQVFHVIPSSQLGSAQMLLPQGQLLDVTATQNSCEEKTSVGELQTVSLSAIEDSTSGYVALSQPSFTMPKNTEPSTDNCFAVPPKPLPPNTPAWARRLRSCEKIGDSFRGYCMNEAELEGVLTLHKQQTQSVWGTRQSPSPAKPATRLMWKSQYVPYDGIPFVNAGSRAIVMECQFGPRRKGLQPKKTVESDINPNQQYKATCPARIYIKKVKKFPEHRVPTDPKVDKKIVRQEQEKAFLNLKKSLWEAGGVLRYYVQLPTQKAHQYHDLETAYFPPPTTQLPLPVPEEEEPEEEEEVPGEDTSCVPSRLHPRVAEKICELVSQGYDQVYMVRKQLRKFVEREMFKADEVPERHNLCYFPTVNDIKNHIHEAQKALHQENPDYNPEAADTRLQWTTDSGNPLTETVTLTLAPTTMEEAPVNSMISKARNPEVSDTLSPEAVQLLSSFSSLQPKMFAQLQPTFNPHDGLPALMAVNAQPLPAVSQATEILDSGSLSTSQPLLLSPTQFLQPSASLSENVMAPPTLVNVSIPDPSLLGMGQLVAVSAVGESSMEGGMHQILLEDGQTIPVDIVDDPASIAQNNSVCSSQEKVEADDKSISEGGNAAGH